MISAFRTGFTHILRSNLLLLSTLAALPILASGCGSTIRPEIGPIEFTTASGASAPSVTSLAVNGQTYLVAAVTHDDQLLGVSWSVTCGSALPPSSGVVDTSCGTLSPAQTLSAPVPTYPATGYVTTYSAPPAVPKGGTVTITAHSTALYSISSSVTLTIESGKASSGARLDRNAREMAGTGSADLATQQGGAHGTGF